MPTLKEISSNKKTKDMPSNQWGEVKKQWSTTLTPTAIELLKGKAKGQGISVSELLERLARAK